MHDSVVIQISDEKRWNPERLGQLHMLSPIQALNSFRLSLQSAKMTLQELQVQPVGAYTFASKSRGIKLYYAINVEVNVFKIFFPNTVIIGSMVESEVGPRFSKHDF